MNGSSNLSKLIKVPLKDVWSSEPGDFTPWLAKEDSLKQLSEELNIDLELQSIETTTGEGSRADIICKDVNDESSIVIENQLDESDDKHLGQIMKYASGIDAKTIVWIAKTIKEEHRSAIDWINTITREDIKIFGVEIEVWKIEGGDKRAPKFNIVSRPNTWTRKAKEKAQKEAQIANNPTQITQLEYWTGFVEYVEEQRKRIPRETLKFPDPNARGVYNIGFNVAGFKYSLSLSLQAKRVSIKLLIKPFTLTGTTVDNHRSFRMLQEKIADQGNNYVWEFNEGKDTSYVMDSIKDAATSDPNVKENWSAQYEWLLSSLLKFHELFTDVVSEMRSELVKEESLRQEEESLRQQEIEEEELDLKEDDVTDVE